MFQSITEKDRNAYNEVVTHPLQSYEWGEFREKTGIKVIMRGFFEKDKLIDGFQLTIHPIPHTKWTIGYLPKGTMPTKELLEELYKIGKENNCVFIQLEPNLPKDQGKEKMKSLILNTKYLILSSAHPLFTKHTFILDLTKTEPELLAGMHPKTRYNIRVAQKHGVEIMEHVSDEAFETYWHLMKETTNRQNFYAHTRHYHALMWKTLKGKSKNELSAHLFIAKYNSPTSPSSLPLAAWVLFTFHKTLYYPYGASSNQYRNVMASNLMMWEAILFGKQQGMETFDMWGSLGENPNPKDPWYGFHRLKQGYGPKLVEFVGSYDLVINPALYQVYKLANILRWLLLHIKRLH